MRRTSGWSLPRRKSDQRVERFPWDSCPFPFVLFMFTPTNFLSSFVSSINLKAPVKLVAFCFALNLPTKKCVYMSRLTTQTDPPIFTATTELCTEVPTRAVLLKPSIICPGPCTEMLLLLCRWCQMTYFEQVFLPSDWKQWFAAACCSAALLQ